MSRAQRIWSGWVIIAVALVVPLGLQALGLGEARVESFLNQPLDVRMRLLDVAEDDLDSLTVGPASPEDFERLGLMSESLALDLQVRVDRSVSPPVVHVTSRKPVSDPVVQLLIDARWSSGRMLREYTLFLDPATVEVEAPAPADAQSRTDPEPVAESDRREPAPREPAPREPTPRESTQDRARPSQTTDEMAQQDRRVVADSGTRRYGPVQSGDTLWSIAMANLPAGEVTMDQMMIAIVELNPQAFRDRNIHHLLRGAELRLPDAEQARAVEASVAAAEVAAQNRAFRQRMASDTPVVSSAGREQEPETARSGREEATTPTSGRSDAGDEVDHRLSLVPPGDEESGNGLSDTASETDELRQRLARAEEELYATRQEAEEFQSRVEELETLVRENPEGFGIRDAELAGLEETLRAAREATGENADPELRSEVSGRLDEYLERYAATAEESGADPEVDPEADPDADAGVGQMAATEPDADADPAESRQVGEASPEDADQRARTETGTSGGLLSNSMLLLVAGLVVLLAIVAAVWIALRRRAQAEPPRTLTRAADLPKTRTGGVTAIEAARSRVESRPTDLAAHLRLLQTLATDGNEAHFGDALESMFDHVESGSEPEWREALELAGRIVPGHLLVKGSTDWSSSAGESEVGKPDSGGGGESDVDDLMSRLESDVGDSNGDDSDDYAWLGREGPDAPGGSEGPLLREDHDAEPGETGVAASEMDGERESKPATHDEDPATHDGDPATHDGDPATHDGDPATHDGDNEPVDFGEWAEVDPNETGPDAGQTDSAAERDDLALDWADDADGSTGSISEPEPDESTERDVGESPEASTDESGDHHDDFFAQSDDDIDVKLDLAKAYLSWNSTDSARTLLEEVVREGNESQQEEARKLLDESVDDSDN